jgi:homoserine O-succinyltransferase
LGGTREADKRLAPKVLARDIFFPFMFIVIQDALMHVLTSVRTYGQCNRRYGAPLRVCVLNLMPLKEPTELQLCRMLGRSSVPIDITWCVPDDYSGKNSAPGYLDRFYKRFSQIKSEKFDGFVGMIFSMNLLLLQYVSGAHVSDFRSDWSAH